MTHPWRSLTIALCPCGDVRAATEMALGTHEPPGAAPHPEVLRDPIWTTWARYHKRVDQAKVLQYAEEICDRSLGRSVMEIDDMWQTRYGDLAFNRKKFPDPKAMVDRLHAMGFQVTLWVMPFAEEHSEAFKFGGPRGYFIRGSGVAAKRREGRADPHGEGHFFNWWNSPRVAALDVTNPEAVEWFVGRLKALQAEVGVDGFKFDGGEPCFLPRGFRTHRPIAHPSEYIELYVREVAGRFEGGVCEVRTGHRTQGVGVLTRMGDRFSTWGVDNGLRSIIPTLLTSGLLGYPFCLPDMVGGMRTSARAPTASCSCAGCRPRPSCPRCRSASPPGTWTRAPTRCAARPWRPGRMCSVTSGSLPGARPTRSRPSHVPCGGSTRVTPRLTASMTNMPSGTTSSSPPSSTRGLARAMFTSHRACGATSCGGASPCTAGAGSGPTTRRSTTSLASRA